jgi:hypothetical protein
VSNIEEGRLSKMRLAAALSLLALVGTSSTDALHAQETDDAFRAVQYGGWDGILFECEPQDDAAWTKDLCRIVGEDARLLATVAKVPIHICVGCDAIKAWEEYGKQMQHELTLTLDVLTTTGIPLGGAITLSASSYYFSAIENTMRSENNDPKSQPKPGRLVFWSHEMAFVGSDPVTHLRPEIEPELKKFFSEFLDAREEYCKEKPRARHCI